MCVLGSYIYKRARSSFHKIGFHLDATLDQESKFPMTKKRGNWRSCLNCTRSAFLPACLAISNVSSIWARIRGYSKLFSHRLHLFFTLVGFSLFSPRWIVLKLAAWLLSHIEGEEKSPHTLCKGEVAKLGIRCAILTTFVESKHWYSFAQCTIFNVRCTHHFTQCTTSEYDEYSFECDTHGV